LLEQQIQFDGQLFVSRGAKSDLMQIRLALMQLTHDDGKIWPSHCAFTLRILGGGNTHREE